MGSAGGAWGRVPCDHAGTLPRLHFALCGVTVADPYHVDGAAPGGTRHGPRKSLARHEGAGASGEEGNGGEDELHGVRQVEGLLWTVPHLIINNFLKFKLASLICS